VLLRPGAHAATRSERRPSTALANRLAGKVKLAAALAIAAAVLVLVRDLPLRENYLAELSESYQPR
jgi:hypothetical protein